MKIFLAAAVFIFAVTATYAQDGKSNVKKEVKDNSKAVPKMDEITNL